MKYIAIVVHSVSVQVYTSQNALKHILSIFQEFFNTFYQLQNYFDISSIMSIGKILVRMIKTFVMDQIP